MPAKLSAARGPRGRVTAAACAMFLLGVGLASPPVQAQSDVAERAPWQAPPGCQTEFAPDLPAGSIVRPLCPVCTSLRRRGRTAKNVAAAQCRRCGGNPDCDFSNPFLCGLGSLFGCDRFWLRAEYLLWWGKSANLPPLATTSPQGTAYDQAGVVGPAGHHGPVRGKRRSGRPLGRPVDARLVALRLPRPGPGSQLFVPRQQGRGVQPDQPGRSDPRPAVLQRADRLAGLHGHRLRPAT